MKKLFLAGLALLSIASVHAQQKEGKVIYQRKSIMQMSFSSQGDAPQSSTQTRTDKFELNFANNQMSWKQMEDEIQDENPSGGAFVIRTMGGGDDVTYCDFSQARKVESREFFDKKFLIADSIRKGVWKVSDETKTILDHVCRKGTSQRIAKRMSMTMANGKAEQKEITDTSSIVAWFTMDIPFSSGPEIQGQLPGLILELEVNNGRTVYTALEISPKPNLSAIKEPTKGKKVTPAEFTEERNKMMAEMQKNNQGRNGVQIRMN